MVSVAKGETSSSVFVLHPFPLFSLLSFQPGSFRLGNSLLEAPSSSTATSTCSTSSTVFVIDTQSCTRQTRVMGRTAASPDHDAYLEVHTIVPGYPVRRN
eukprot:2545174-Rhodomonas_salina.1